PFPHEMRNERAGQLLSRANPEAIPASLLSPMSRNLRSWRRYPKMQQEVMIVVMQNDDEYLVLNGVPDAQCHPELMELNQTVHRRSVWERRGFTISAGGDAHGLHARYAGDPAEWHFWTLDRAGENFRGCLYGACPVQGVGVAGELPWYFRA